MEAFFQRIQIKERALRDNEAKIIRENVFNGDQFRSEGNHEYSNNEKAFFSLFLQNYLYLNTYIIYIFIYIYTYIYIYIYIYMYVYILYRCSVGVTLLYIECSFIEQ